MRIIWTRGNLKKDFHFCRDYFKSVQSFPSINFGTDGFNSPYRSLRGLRVNPDHLVGSFSAMNAKLSP